jgi:aspartate racemase
MIEETAREAARRVEPGTPVGILATAGTVEVGLYQNALQAVGLTPLTPGEAAQQEVTTGIRFVKRGEISRAATEHVLVAARELVERGAQVLLAACTELPLILHQDDVNVLLIDPTQVLAEAAVRKAMAPGAAAEDQEKAGADVVRA